MNDRLWYLFGKKLSGEASQNELEQLHYLESSNPYAAFYFRELSAWWKLTEQVGSEDARQIFEAHLQKIQEERSAFNLWLERENAKKHCSLTNWLSK